MFLLLTLAKPICLLFHFMYLNWIYAQIELMLKIAGKEKNWVSLGGLTLDVWKFDWEIGRDQFLQGISGYYRDNWQVWLTNT